MQRIEKDLAKTKAYLQQRLGIPDHFGLVYREFRIRFADGEADGVLCYFDGMSDDNYINRDIMRNLLLGGDGVPSAETERKTVIAERLTALGALSLTEDFDEALEALFFGNCIFFADGCDCAFVADVKNWKGRGVGEPTQEASISGPQEAFNEVVMTNMALVRKILKTPDLMSEKISVGTVSKTPCAVMYLKGVTNEELVREVRRRLEGIETSYVFSTGDVEMMIEDSSFFPMTRTLKTERPDRTAAMIAEGKVAVIVHGSPFALILPSTAADFLEASEDNYARLPEANFMRMIRLVGMVLSLLLPGLFAAVMLYHAEVVPTDLLLAIEASRERVPFPLLAELLLMELAFELIKEASIRVPSPVGSTLGIIGGLILGQAAVDAEIVSPILIIVVSVAGLGTFAAPSASFARSLSLMRFLFLLFGGIGGGVGIVCALFIFGGILGAAESMGVPFLSPFAPKNGDSVWGSLLVKPIWKKELRPKSLQPKDRRRQPPISRRWKR